MRLLIDQIEGVEEGGREVSLPTQLIIRESCGTYGRG
jgi:DNA-binding LacI/PurR family transcriptional regulator